MKIDITQAIPDIKLNPIKTQSGEPWTLKEALATACLGTYQGDNPTGDEKYKRWKLANKIEAANTEVELAAEEVVLLKKLSGAVFPTLSAGAIWSMLEK